MEVRAGSISTSRYGEVCIAAISNRPDLGLRARGARFAEGDFAVLVMLTV
jgi:hypothetical protein